MRFVKSGGSNLRQSERLGQVSIDDRASFGYGFGGEGRVFSQKFI